ncbi:MAG: SDR family NAD(P)-dependent oxidoreductase [Deltaproteobacteria bacterium]|nr:MAG: SDR family NAD(P)-dependent oxidoreductase [Deltaproteobacteria bacterium]
MTEILPLVVVTGANSGLGLQTAKHLLLKGYAVLLACRNLSKAIEAQQWLHEQTGKQQTQIGELDLGSLQSIRDFASQCPSDVYGLVCNAGLQYDSGLRKTLDGFEETFGVNHLGHFLLTNLLLKKSPSLQRIAIVSSALHDSSIKSPVPGPNYTSPREMAFPAESTPSDGKIAGERYSTSKLCNLYFAYELVERLQAAGREGVLVNAFNPGLIPGTGLGRNSSGFTKFLWYYVMPFMSFLIPGMSTTDRSGEHLADLIDDVDTTGKYYDIGKVTPSSDESYLPERRMELWEESVKLVGLTEEEQWS